MEPFVRRALRSSTSIFDAFVNEIATYTPDKKRAIFGKNFVVNILFVKDTPTFDYYKIFRAMS